MPVINRAQPAEGIYKAIFVGLIFALFIFGATIAVAITAQDYQRMSGNYSHCFDEIDRTAWETAITELEHLSNGQNWNLSDAHRNNALGQGLNFDNIDVDLFQRQFRTYLQPCINICLQSMGQVNHEKSEFDPTGKFRILQNNPDWSRLIRNWAVQYCQQIEPQITILEDLRGDCAPVPDLTGKTYGEAQDYLLVGLPEGKRFSSNLLVIEGDKKVRYGLQNPKVMNLKIIEQDPAAGVLVDRVIKSLAVKLELLTIEKVEIKPLGKPILFPGESLELKADVLFSNGERKDITHSPECVWESEDSSIILVENGKATLGKGIPQKSSYTVSAKYSYMGTTVESATLTIKVSKEKASNLRLDVLGPKELWSSYAGPRVKIILIHSDNSEEDVTDGDKTRLEAKPKEIWLGNTYGTGLQIGAWFPDGSKLKKIHIRGVHARNDDFNDLIYSDWVGFRLKKGHVIVPDIGGQSLEEAKKTLRSYGFSSIKARVYDRSCQNMKNEGRAYSSDGGPGQIADTKATIEIWMDGSVVPDIVGMSEADAESALLAKDLKFKTMKRTWFKPEYKAGHVIAQGPKAGKCLMPGELVVATLNGSPIPVNIPDLIGKSEEEARSIIKSVSLVPSVKTAKKWVRGSGDGIVVDQNPSAGRGQTVLPGATITVWLNPPLPSMGIIVKPNKRSYKLGAKINFKQNVKLKNPNNTYTFKWEVDGNPVATGEEFTYTFDQPGRHYVQLILESSDPQENDAIIKNIDIEYPPDPELGIFVIPRELPVVAPFKPGQRVDFLENCKNIPNHPKYNWYFEDNKIGSGPRINNYKLPDEKGSYDLRLGVRFGSDNFDALKKTITITVGDPPIKPLGRWRNKFRAEGPMTNLRIQSSEWQPGFTWPQGIGPVKSIPAKWKDWVMVRNLGSVEGYDLYTGQQSGGHNSGFLVYLPSGSEKLQYKVFGHDFVKHKGVLNHDGYLNMHGKVPDPQSIRWVDKKSRAGVVQWQTTDGNLCKARIWKPRGSSIVDMAKGFFITGGVEDLGCSASQPSVTGYDPASDPGLGGSSSGTGTVTQLGQQFQNSIASTGTSSGSGQGGAGNLTNVTVSQHDITVTFWDHGKEDGDIINIYLNEQLFKGNVRLTNKKKKLQVKLNSGINTFEIEAVNEGSIPPNTASVRISHVTLGRATQIYERKSGKRASMNLSAP